MPSIVQIFIATERGTSMRALHEVKALVDRGLDGDRYADAKYRESPNCQVTLIELENIEAFTHTTGLALSTDAPRRNIVTSGIRLNDLCGKRFKVGEAEFEGLELCEPCGLFAKRTHREVIKLFLRKGGLRARIIKGGVIRVGDRVEVERSGRLDHDS